jgi:thiamine biosynthesis lipoprotein
VRALLTTLLLALPCAPARPLQQMPAGPPQAPARAAVLFAGPAMGARYSVRVVLPAGDSAANARVQAAIDGELARVDRLFSKWNPDSELSRFNAQGSTDPFAASSELVEAVLTAGRAAEQTGGAFDATVAPLIEAWGFGPAGRPAAMPSAEAIAAARARVGHALLSADPARHTIRKARADVAIDLNGLAGGWLADRIAGAVVALGYPDVLADGSGEITARGRRADGGPWRVAVESPIGARAPRSPVIDLVDACVATSGDYRNFWTDEQGRHRSHIVDPRSGVPVAHGLASVTVVHADGAWADALGTGLLVLGPQEARAFATRAQLAVRLVERRPDGSWAEWSSPEFEALLVR